MAKRFKCPECGKFLRSLCATNHCNTELNIDFAGVVRITHVCAPRNPIFYYCSHCNHKETEPENFISEIECTCEHLETSLEICGKFKYRICTRCKLVTTVTRNDRKPRKVEQP